MSLSPDQIRALFDYPIRAPPPGIVPNFETSVSNRQVLYASAGICYVVIFTAVGFKIAAKFTTVNKTITYSDGMLLFSAIGVVSWIAMVVAAIGGHAFGRHSWNVKLSYFTKDQLLFSQLTSAFYPLWILTIKLSVFLMYLELFHRKQWLRYWCYVGMVILISLHLVFVVLWAVTCRPRGGQNQVAYLAGFLAPSCAKGRTPNILQSVLNLSGDLFLIVLPLPAIWRLHMTWRKKVSVSAMFLTGFCGVAASVAALFYRLQIFDGQQDNTWRTTYTWTASAFEMTAGILVVCMPSIAAVMKKCMATVGTRLSSRRNLSSPRSHRKLIHASSACDRSYWWRSSSSTAEAPLTSATMLEEPKQPVIDSDGSNSVRKSDHACTTGPGNYRAQAVSDGLINPSSRTELGPREIQKTTEFDVRTIER